MSALIVACASLLTLTATYRYLEKRSTNREFSRDVARHIDLLEPRSDFDTWLDVAKKNVQYNLTAVERLSKLNDPSVSKFDSSTSV